MMNERPFAKYDMWTATGFCVVLSAITVIGMLATNSRPGGDNSGTLMVFLCNLPMVFLFVGYSTRRAHERIKVLENRMQSLEAAQAAK